MNSYSVSGGTRRSWMRLSVLSAKAAVVVLLEAVLAAAVLAEMWQEERELEAELAVKAVLADREVLCPMLADREARAADRAEP